MKSAVSEGCARERVVDVGHGHAQGSGHGLDAIVLAADPGVPRLRVAIHVGGVHGRDRAEDGEARSVAGLQHHRAQGVDRVARGTVAALRVVPVVRAVEDERVGGARLVEDPVDPLLAAEAARPRLALVEHAGAASPVAPDVRLQVGAVTGSVVGAVTPGDAVAESDVDLGPVRSDGEGGGDRDVGARGLGYGDRHRRPRRIVGGEALRAQGRRLRPRRDVGHRHAAARGALRGAPAHGYGDRREANGLRGLHRAVAVFVVEDEAVDGGSGWGSRAHRPAAAAAARAGRESEKQEYDA